MLLVFLGPPGAGKGTQSTKLTEYFGIPHLSTGEMLRNAYSEGTKVGRLAEAYMTSGQLVPDPIILSIVGERLERGDFDKGCLFDGFPRTIGQAQSLDLSLKHRGTPLSGVLELRVDNAELEARLMSRGRADDRIDVVRQRLKSYHDATQPLVEYYEAQGLLRPIDGTGSPEEVFERIKKVC